MKPKGDEDCVTRNLSNSQLAPPNALQLGQVTVRDGSETIASIRDALSENIAKAIAAEGWRALENPRSSAIFHEAGHAVVLAAFGEAVRRCKVWRCKRGIDRGQWLGLTMGGGKWKTDASTSPDEDFRRACCLMAGVLAEGLFDPGNVRRASSLDEIMTAIMVASNIAIKTGGDPADVMQQVISATTNILKRNADVMLAIAGALDRQKVLRKAKLAPLLARVSTSGAEDLRRRSRNECQ